MKLINLSENIKQNILKILFFLILFFPLVYQNIKIIFIFLLFPFLTINVRKIKLKKDTILWIFLYIAIFFIWGIFGIFNKNPGSLALMKIYILWIFLFGSIFICLRKKDFICVFDSILVTQLFIVIYNVLAYIVYVFFREYYYLFFKLNTNTFIGIHEGYTQIISHNIGSLLVTFPIFMNILYFRIVDGKKNKKYYILLIITIILIFLSGRRALQVILLLTSLLNLLLIYPISKIKIKKILLLFFILISTLITYIVYKYPYIFIRIIQGIWSTKDGAFDNVRKIQNYFIWNDFLKRNIILGTGLGSEVAGIKRSELFSFTFESANLKLLHELGVIGISLFVCLIIYLIVIYYKLLLSKSNEKFKYYVGSLLSFVALLLGNFTNPYLGRFDFIWILILPILIYNLEFNEIIKIKE